MAKGFTVKTAAPTKKKTDDFDLAAAKGDDKRKDNCILFTR